MWDRGACPSGRPMTTGLTLKRPASFSNSGLPDFSFSAFNAAMPSVSARPRSGTQQLGTSMLMSTMPQDA